MTWRHYLRVKTRDPGFLWRMVAAILAIGVVVGGVVSQLPWLREANDAESIARAIAADRPGHVTELVDQVLNNDAEGFAQLLDLMPALWATTGESAAAAALPRMDFRQQIVAVPLDDQRRQIALGLWDSFDQGQPVPELLALAASEPPPRYANRALAVFWQQLGARGQAAVAYEREGRVPAAVESRRRAIEIYVREDAATQLERLWQTPGYAEEFSALATARLAVHRGDWWTVCWALARSEWQRLAPGATAIAAIAGLAWLVFCLQAAQVDSSQGARWWLCVAAVALGIVSVWPTDMLILWQEETWDLVATRDLVGGLRYFILGVGFREELAKLVCFLPLVPWLVPRRNELETLVVAACVGLGFAAAENSRYFAASAGSDSVSRFLTANFFHMAATGLAGLALCRALWYPRTRGLELPAIFGLLVCAHGLYDALIVLPALAEYRLVGVIIYVGLAYQFFHELRTARPSRRETVSLTATFLVAVSCLTAATFVYLCAGVGWTGAVERLTPEALGMSLMAYMFLREMPESLVES